jgi:hypothetical protein
MRNSTAPSNAVWMFCKNTATSSACNQNRCELSQSHSSERSTPAHQAGALVFQQASARMLLSQAYDLLEVLPFQCLF